MQEELMAICERKTQFKNLDNGEKYLKWKEVPVTSLSSGEQPHIRCAHCHGRVTVHKQQVEHGQYDHVQHLSRKDSENCKGGSYFKGEHKMSLCPVE